ncbi:MAG: hypothetical protein ACREQJ_13105, partial [Candidatus Binatia bacterium]
VSPSRLSGLYLVKVVAGVAAISFNYGCFILVSRRRVAAARANHAEVLRYSKMIDWTLYLGGPFALIALGIALFGI